VTDTKINVLEVASSGRIDGSVSRELTADLLAALADRHGDVEIARRDLADGLPFVDADWIAANFTPDEERTKAHRNTLALSDELVTELRAADVLVIGAPMYNFSIPAALKAWIDMIARARLTFRYTENGPVGLLEGKKAYIVAATGGVPIGSPVDFATPYLKHALAFIGITNVNVIAADRLNSNPADSIDDARAKIADAVHLVPAA